MKITEEGHLKKAIDKFNSRIKENGDFKAFFDNSLQYDIKSLQKEAFKDDAKLFKDISFILSVIMSIIARPHLFTRKEEIIVRADLAPRVDVEDFKKTTKNSQLWKNQNNEKIPEYVYYSEYIDEIKIYENIFVVYLVDLIGKELNIYHNFYQNLIKTYDSNSLSVKGDFTLSAVEQVTKLKKKIKFIYASRFYKEIKKGGINLREIHPSNILINDHLYNYCFKFYKQLVKYNDNSEKNFDLRTYYFILMMKKFRKLGFEFTSVDGFGIDESNHLSYKDLLLENDDFSILLNQVDSDKLIYKIINKNVNKKANEQLNMLLFNIEDEFEKYSEDLDKKYNNYEVLSLWNFYQVEENNFVNKNLTSEEELINLCFDIKVYALESDRKYYSLFCPVCKEQIEEGYLNGYCNCGNCGTKYTFYRKEKKNYLWFIEYRPLN